MFHVDRCPSYTKCIHFKVPIKDDITEDAELDDLPDIEQETYVKIENRVL
jgi:hypothetical protein